MSNQETEFRAVQGEIRMSSDEKRSTFWISTNAIDRHGSIVEPDGMDVEKFLKNPIVMWEHGWDSVRGRLPIGKCVSIKRLIEGDKNGWIATVEWANDAFSQDIKDKVKNGFLSMTSVGFRSLERSFRDILGKEVMVHVKSQLTEFSVVTIGSNSQALVNQRGEEKNTELKRIEDTLNVLVEKLSGNADAVPTVTDSVEKVDESATVSTSENYQVRRAKIVQDVLNERKIAEYDRLVKEGKI